MKQATSQPTHGCNQPTNQPILVSKSYCPIFVLLHRARYRSWNRVENLLLGVFAFWKYLIDTICLLLAVFCFLRNLKSTVFRICCCRFYRQNGRQLEVEIQLENIKIEKNGKYRKWGECDTKQVGMKRVCV